MADGKRRVHDFASTRCCMNHKSLFEYVNTLENKPGMIKEYGVQANACTYVEVAESKSVGPKGANRQEAEIGLRDQFVCMYLLKELASKEVKKKGGWPEESTTRTKEKKQAGLERSESARKESAGAIDQRDIEGSVSADERVIVSRLWRPIELKNLVSGSSSYDSKEGRLARIKKFTLHTEEILRKVVM